MEQPLIRPARPGDAADLARNWVDVARHYAELDPDAFQVPVVDGLVAWFEGLLRRPRPEDAIWLVAELDGQVVGDVSARLERPADDAGRQLLRDLGRIRLSVDALGGAGGLPAPRRRRPADGCRRGVGEGPGRRPLGADHLPRQPPVSAVLRAGHGLRAPVDRPREAPRRLTGLRHGPRLAGKDLARQPGKVEQQVRSDTGPALGGSGRSEDLRPVDPTEGCS